jgi:chemotaxis protein methyltransferase CheR/type IV pilus assembly protein PilK
MALGTVKFIGATDRWQMQNPPPMDEALFQQWREMLESRIGFTLPKERKSFLITSLAVRMREVNCDSYAEYLKLLESGRHGAVEWEILVDRLTVHETRFCRDKQAMQLVERELHRRAQADPEAPVKLDIWSVGCATGEEPYSLAIAIDHYLRGNNRRGLYSVMATDISRASLASAREGVFHRNRLKNMPVELLRNYFLPYDLDHYQLIKRVRDRVCFTRLNLMDLDASRLGRMDVIFCQNVLIYFRRERRIEIVNRLVDHLRPGGVLILGAGEIVKWKHPAMVPIVNEDVIAYRRELEEDAVL